MNTPRPISADPVNMDYDDDDDVDFSFNENQLFSSKFLSNNDSISDEDESEDDEEEASAEEELSNGVNEVNLNDGASHDTPFWFSNEDKFQVRNILDYYTKILNLEEERKGHIREPIPFVGRVKRCPVENHGIFSTLDMVDVFRKCLLPPGSPLPLLRTQWILTSWSFEEGVPFKSFILNDDNLKSFWRQKVDMTSKPSFLLCLPLYHSQDYDYFVQEEEFPVTYSPQTGVRLSFTLPIYYYNRFISQDMLNPPKRASKLPAA